MDTPTSVDTPTSKGDDPEARARALALLEATHQFPCSYSVTVIALNDAPITEAVHRTAREGAKEGAREGDGTIEETEELVVTYESRPSRGGKYLSHRFDIRVGEAAHVLDLYARFRAVEGVITLL